MIEAQKGDYMLEVVKLKKNSVGSGSVTFATNKSVPTEDCVNPYAPFFGVDGKKYIIGYDQRLNTTTNCYAFAMGWRVPAKNKYDDYVPGFLAGMKFSIENSAKIVKADLEAVGRTVYEILYEIPEELPDGDGYWIKFMYCPEKTELDAHFMRKDKKSGRWIHKMGWEMPPKVCVRNLEFKDKKEALLESPELKGTPKDIAESVLKTMFPKHMYTGIVLARSEIETVDSADYLAFSDAEVLMNYKTMWAMRISEP